MDAQANLAYSLVAAAPSPAASGLTLDVTTGTGTRFPAVPFNATIWPASTMPTPANAEIVRVTNITTDTLTITRAQEGTSARTVIVGDQIAATVTKLTFDDVVSTIGVASALATTANSHADTASAAATSADVHAAAASAAATSVDARVNTVSNLVSALTSAHNALSNVVSDSLSIGDVASNFLSALAVSVETLSAKVVSISAQLTSLEVHASTASAAATSVDGRVTSVNAVLASVSALSAGGVSTHGLQSVINALSNRISAVVGGTGSVTSTEVSAGDAAVSAQAASANASVINTISARLVLGHVIGSSPPTRILSAVATVEGTTLTVVSGLSVTVSAGVTYKMELVAFVNRVTTQVTGFGLKFPPLVNDIQGGGIFQTWSSLVQSVGAGGAGMQPWRADASGSILVSVSTGGAASTVVLARGILVVSTGGEVALLAKASVSPSHCLVQPGSYLELKRLA